MRSPTTTSHARAAIGSAAAVVALIVGGAIAPVPLDVHAAATSVRLMVDFDAGDPLTPGSTVHDASGFANHGVVRVAYGGRIVATGGGAAAFPSGCTTEPCPNAMIRVPSSSSLNPGRADVEWGAIVRLAPEDTADGENVVQKGRWGDPDGMWKLQVDKLPARPSCVVAGTAASGGVRTTTVRSSVGIADGRRHRVVCRRVGRTITIFVDGVARGSATAEIVRLGGTAPVTIGAKDVASRDNDQFHGTLDDVYMALI